MEQPHDDWWVCHSQLEETYQQVLQCTAVLLQDRSEKNGPHWHNFFLTPYGAKLGTDCYKLHSHVELPSYVTCYILINSNAQFRNTAFAVNNCVSIISLLVCIRPYVKPDTNGVILQKPQHFRSNRHCLTCIHRNPEHLTLNLCCAHAFIHGFLVPFI